jgi:NADPH2:quinone reductase
MVIIGFTSVSAGYSTEIARIHPLSLFHRSVSVAGLNVENLDFPRRSEVWQRMVAHLEEHGLAPEIGPRFPLAEASAAHAALEGRRTRGKVLLIP